MKLILLTAEDTTVKSSKQLQIIITAAIASRFVQRHCQHQVALFSASPHEYRRLLCFSGWMMWRKSGQRDVQLQRTPDGGPFSEERRNMADQVMETTFLGVTDTGVVRKRSVKVSGVHLQPIVSVLMWSGLLCVLCTFLRLFSVLVTKFLSCVCWCITIKGLRDIFVFFCSGMLSLH